VPRGAFRGAGSARRGAQSASLGILHRQSSKLLLPFKTEPPLLGVSCESMFRELNQCTLLCMGNVLVPASTVPTSLYAPSLPMVSLNHNVSCHLEPLLILSFSIFFIILLLWPYPPSTAPSSITDLYRLHSHKPETPRSIVSHNSFL
jgi:hypothetical protein